MTYQNPYIADRLITGTADTAQQDPFLLPLCLTYTDYHRLLGALWFARGLYADTEDYANIDHALAVLIAQQYIDDPTNAPCWPTSECDFCDTIQAIIDTLPAGPEAFLTELAQKLIECCAGISLPPPVTEFPDLCDLLTAQTGAETDIPTLIAIAEGCGIIVAFDFDAEAVTLEPGSSATATYDNASNKFIFGIPQGVTGQQGPEGPTGPEGDCDCGGTNDEPPPEAQTDEACGSAYNVIDKLDSIWQRMLDVIETNPSDEFAVLEDVTGVNRLIYSFAGSLIQFIVTNGSLAWRTTLTDNIADIACALYCDGITKSVFLSYAASEFSGTPFLYTALEQLINSVTDDQWDEWVSLGKLKNTAGACDTCNCRDGAWCYTWLSGDGWSPAWALSPGYLENDVLKNGTSGSGQSGQIVIRWDFAQAVDITEFTVEAEFFGGANDPVTNQWLQGASVPGEILRQIPDGITGVITETTGPHPGATVLRCDIGCPETTPGAGLHIRKITVRGTGTNPFGPDNCP